MKAFEEAKRILIDALKYLNTQAGATIEVKSKNVQYLLLYAKVNLEEDMQYADWKFKENAVAR